jgi:hypothetical protein
MTARETDAAERRLWGRLVGSLVLAAALSSCQLKPSPPLLSPIQATNGEYGYADLPLGDNRYQVSYTGPSQRSLRSTEARQQVAATERAQAYDFALWHAAQITLAQGYTGFRVSNVRTNVDSMVEPDYDPSYAPDWHPANRFGGPLMGRYWGGYVSPSLYIDTRTQIVIDIALLRSLETGDYDASETIDRLSKAYPGATGPVVPPAGQ